MISYKTSFIDFLGESYAERFSIQEIISKIVNIKARVTQGQPTMQIPHDKDNQSPNLKPSNLRESANAKGFWKTPVIFLTGIWLVLMILGWLSMAEIISPGANAPLPKTPIAEAQREKNSSLGVLGAIAASCALVSVLLAQKMERR